MNARLRPSLSLLTRLAAARAAHAGLGPAPLPINLTLSVTRRCNSRCRTCRIWDGREPRAERPELSVEEFDRLFAAIGPTFFFNLSGGEPFLRDDLPEIVAAACRRLHPRVVHIPTNALLGPRVVDGVRRILETMRAAGFGTTGLTVKPSLDGVEEEHDWIRGVRGNYRRVLEVVEGLKALRSTHPNLRIGLGAVASTLNLHRLPAVMAVVDSLGVDTLISEVAEERREMANAGSGITPTADAYRAAIRPLQQRTRRELRRLHGVELLTQALRILYYDLTADWLAERRQPIPCFAGITNAHVSADGELWPCAVRGDGASFGNLRDAGFDFRRPWHSPRADEIRRSIRRGECDCPLANQAYANLLLDPPSLARAAALIARSRLPEVFGDAPPAPPVVAAEYLPDREHPLDREHPELLAAVRERGLRMRVPRSRP